MFIEAGQGDRFRPHNVYMARQVALVLSPREDPASSVPISFYFPQEKLETKWGYGSEPICIVLPSEPPRDATSIELLRALTRIQMQRDPPCVLRETGGRI
jgi:hypothetical protein